MQNIDRKYIKSLYEYLTVSLNFFWRIDSNLIKYIILTILKRRKKNFVLYDKYFVFANIIKINEDKSIKFIKSNRNKSLEFEI